MSLIPALAAACLTSAAVCLAAGGKAGPSSYERVLLGNGQDPSIVYHEGWYYYADVDFAHRVYVWKSQVLDTIFEGTQIEVYRDNTRVVTEAPDIALVYDAHGCKCNRWVITYSTVVDDGVSVLITEDDDVTKGWTPLGPIPGVKGYDSNLLQHPSGAAYLLFSSYDALNIIPMEDIFRGAACGDPVVISRPTLPWEGAGLNEAPASVISGDTINVVYSTGRYYEPSYNCGLLTASIWDDPLDPASWHKAPYPVFFSNPARSFYGPGSGTFFRPNNRDVWWAYGGFTSSTGIDKHSGQRVIRAQPVWFETNGTVVLGEAGGPSSMQILQPGEQEITA